MFFSRARMMDRLSVMGTYGGGRKYRSSMGLKFTGRKYWSLINICLRDLIAEFGNRKKRSNRCNMNNYLQRERDEKDWRKFQIHWNECSLSMTIFLENNHSNVQTIEEPKTTTRSNRIVSITLTLKWLANENIIILSDHFHDKKNSLFVVFFFDSIRESRFSLVIFEWNLVD